MAKNIDTYKTEVIVIGGGAASDGMFKVLIGLCHNCPYGHIGRSARGHPYINVDRFCGKFC